MTQGVRAPGSARGRASEASEVLRESARGSGAGEGARPEGDQARRGPAPGQRPPAGVGSAHEEQSQLLAKADKYLAGGGLGLFTLPPEVNLVIREGQGSHITSISGQDYIDYHLGSGPALLGHGHPAVTAAVSAQLPNGTTYYFLNQHVLRLAERLVEAIPCAEQVQFSGSGTEATFFALRAARSLTGRTKIMKLEGGWHGMHDYALWGTVPSTPSDYPRARPDSTGIPPSVGEQVLVAPFNETARTVSLIEKHAHELAAVLVEPLQRVLVPEPGFLEAIREVTARHNVVLIFDEIVTGFRYHLHGASRLFGVQPDLITLGKGMANGYAVAALAGRASIMMRGGLDHAGERVFLLSTTNGAEQSGLAAGIATINFYRSNDVIAHLAQTGRAAAAAVREAAAAAGVEGFLKAEGDFECRPVVVCLDHEGTPSPAHRTLFLQELIRHGVFMPWICPSYRHGESELAQTAEACRQAARVYAQAIERRSVDGLLVGAAVKPVMRRYN